jgi:RNA polymerase sigma factor (sigma-70 family)
MRAKEFLKEIRPYDPDSATYRGEKMPSIDPDDMMSRRTYAGEPAHKDLSRFKSPVTDIDKAEDRMDLEKLRSAVRANISTLDPREREFIDLRFFQNMTLEQVGKAMGFGTERARQIEARTLRKLRTPSRANKLRPFLDPEAGVNLPDRGIIKVDPRAKMNPYYMAGYQYGLTSSESPKFHEMDLDYGERNEFNAGFVTAQRQKKSQ